MSLREYSYNNSKYGFECLPEDQYRKHDEEIIGSEPEFPTPAKSVLDDVIGELEETTDDIPLGMMSPPPLLGRASIEYDIPTPA